MAASAASNAALAGLTAAVAKRRSQAEVGFGELLLLATASHEVGRALCKKLR